MFDFLKRRLQPQEFWDWLAANTSKIRRGGPKGLSRLADEISGAFDRTYPGLVWEITPNDSGAWCFCISAGGNADQFERVKSAVAKAPEIAGWSIKAFRQRGPLDATIAIQGRELGYDDIWCDVESRGTGAVVTLLVRGLTLDNAQALLGAALVLLDNAVGEYDSVLKIVELNNGPMPKNVTRSASRFPLADLPKYLDGLC